MNKPCNHVVVIAIAGALLLLLASCGGDDSGDGGSFFDSSDGGSGENSDGRFVIEGDGGGGGPVPTFNPNPDPPGFFDRDEGDSGGDEPSANVRLSHAEDLRKGECIDPIDTEGYATVLPCSEARLKVLVVVEMPDSGWTGDEYLEDAANEYCPDETDFRYWPNELRWIFGARHILCLVDNSPGGSEGFDSGSLAGRWDFGPGYYDLELDSVRDASDGPISVYTFDEYGVNAFGVYRRMGSGEMIVRADGAADVSGTNDAMVFLCFDVRYEGSFNFTDDEFFGAIWCEGEASDPAELRGYRQ